MRELDSGTLDLFNSVPATAAISADTPEFSRAVGNMMPSPIELAPLTDTPLVSVIIANYNYGRFLTDAVRSVVDQSYTNWELIVCDDGSTDDSATIAQTLERSDPRITVLLKENGGQVSAWNHAYQHCLGDIICFLDADDTFHSHKLEMIVQTFRAQPRCGFAYHQFQYANQDLNVLPGVHPSEMSGGWLAEQALARGGFVFSATPAQLSLRAELAASIFPLPATLRFADGYICRVAPFLTEIASVAEPLSYYRIHGQNAIGSTSVLEEHSLESLLELLIDEFNLQHYFLSEKFGSELADCLQFTDLRGAWRVMSALYILKGKPSEGIRGFHSADMLGALSTTRQKHIWEVLFALPAPISKRLLRLWWSDAGWKRLVQPITGMLGMRERRTVG
jgi:hypothetical protein